MKRLMLIGVAMIGVMARLGVARYVARVGAPRLMERMMENVMPRMMDACFGRASHEQREFMLSHCRGMLDRMDEKYRVTQPTEPAESSAARVGVA